MGLLTFSITGLKSNGLCRYELHGSIHKELMFFEYMGQLYNNEVSEKFVEYLNLCIRKSLSLAFVDFH